MNLFSTIEEGKQYIDSHKKEGCNCPCCGNFLKIYKRKYNSNMAQFLIALYKVHKSHGHINYIYYRDVLESVGNLHGGDYTKNLYWGLIQQNPVVEVGKKCSGYFKITPSGVGFVERSQKIMEVCEIYQGEVLKFSGKTIMINQVSKFNYEELIKT